MAEKRGGVGKKENGKRNNRNYLATNLLRGDEKKDG